VGDVLNASNEEVVEPERPLRQSWVLMTREPSAQIIEARSDAIVGTADAGEESLGMLAVKLAIVDGTKEELFGQSS
jgi:hypothetical protein